MRNASIDLKKSIDNGALFKTKATITFANGEAKELSEKDFYITGNSFSESTGTSSFPYGQNVAKSIRIRLVNNNEQFSDYDFANAKISLSVAWKNNDKEENILIGNYTVIEPEAYGDSISVSAVDDMYKGNATYETSLVFPQTLEYMLIDSCNSCGVSVDTSTLRNKDYLVYVKPDGITHRELWGYIAMLGGGNARFDENNVLKIVPYDLSFFSREGLDGGTFLTKDTLYSDGDNADGGNFNDYSSGDSYDGGTFEELNRYHTFYRGKTPTIATDDVIITGVKVTVNADEYISGNDGYVLSVNNPLVEGDELNGIQIIGENVIGMRFRPFSIDNTAYPIAEFGDICYVSDRKGNFYQSVVTDITFNFFGYTNVKCSADNPVRNSSKQVANVDTAVTVLRKETKEALESIDESIEDIEHDLYDEDGAVKTSFSATNGLIEAEVSRANKAEGQLNSKISLTENNIFLEVQRAKEAEENLLSRIQLTEGEIEAKVEKGESYNGFVIDENGVTVSGTGAFVVDMSNLKINSDGTVEIIGKIDAKSGSFAGYNITGTSFINNWGAGFDLADCIANWLHSTPGNDLSIGSTAGKTIINGTDVEIVKNPKFTDLGMSDKAPNVYVGQAYRLNQTTGSSEKFKNSIKPVEKEELDPRKLLDVDVVQFKFNTDYFNDVKNPRYDKEVIGFIAEDVLKKYPIAADVDKNGNAENWNYRYMIPPMLKLIQDQHKELQELKELLYKKGVI